MPSSSILKKEKKFTDSQKYHGPWALHPPCPGDFKTCIELINNKQGENVHMLLVPTQSTSEKTREKQWCLVPGREAGRGGVFTVCPFVPLEFCAMCMNSLFIQIRNNFSGWRLIPKQQESVGRRWKNMGFGARVQGFIPVPSAWSETGGRPWWIKELVTKGPWLAPSTSLSLSFLFLEMGILIPPLRLHQRVGHDLPTAPSPEQAFPKYSLLPLLLAPAS